MICPLLVYLILALMPIRSTTGVASDPTDEFRKNDIWCIIYWGLREIFALMMTETRWRETIRQNGPFFPIFSLFFYGICFNLCSKTGKKAQGYRNYWERQESCHFAAKTRDEQILGSDRSHPCPATRTPPYLNFRASLRTPPRGRSLEASIDSSTSWPSIKPRHGSTMA